MNPAAPTRLRAKNRTRFFQDIVAKYLVGIGGISVIIAILLIFFYLLLVVFPLFESAESELVARYQADGVGSAKTLHLTIEEQAEVAARFLDSGEVTFFNTQNGNTIKKVTLTLAENTSVSSFAVGDHEKAIAAYGMTDGKAVIVKHKYKITFPNDVRNIEPLLAFPLGESPVVMDEQGRALVKLAIQSNEEETTLIAQTADKRIVLSNFLVEESLLGDEADVTRTAAVLDGIPHDVDFIQLDNNQRLLYLLSKAGDLTVYDITDKSTPVVEQVEKVVATNRNITAVELLSGSISLMIADDAGNISQWFHVRDPNNKQVLTKIREFSSGSSPILTVHAEMGRKGFLVGDQAGNITIFHATANNKVHDVNISKVPVQNIAIAPRANAMLIEDSNGELSFWSLDNEHPEISFSALWGKVWYESYPEPQYIWQSSSASNDFEPKFSLMPLSFGTLKAAFFAMLLAVPLSILGAVFTAHFMSSQMRQIVKPSIEIMEALPTVILGFLAGLWLAPMLEANLPGVFSMLIIVPFGIIIAAYAWTTLPERIRHKVPDGWEAALLIPVVLVLGAISMSMSPVMETVFFGGNMRSYLTNDLGISFDQRNSIVVGLAMGFAVIPTIFSITEDAIFSVPRHLSQGSLALGATQWQTLVRVVILTASPGIFSAVMIGLGRAVGETMIVLMATGNTPVMDLSIFQGMRTLSANIAVEMPESEVDSTHYRVLFLAALVLFMFTFFFNTLAELVRQRLRKKYSSL